MRAAFLCYLTQAWTADRYRRPSAIHQPGPPAGPATPGHRRAPSGGLAICRTSDGGCRVTSCVLARE